MTRGDASLGPRWDHAGDAVVVRFHALSPREGLARYGRRLLGHRDLQVPVGIILALVLMLVAVGQRQNAILLFAVGPGVVTVLLALGAVRVALTTVPPRTLTFAPDRLVEEVEGRVTPLSWNRVRCVLDDGVVLQVYLQGPGTFDRRGELLIDRRVVHGTIVDRLLGLLAMNGIRPAPNHPVRR